MALLGLFRAKKADVLSHWYTPVPNFSTSTQEFYAAVEKELKEQQVPDLKISRVEFSEGGFFSGKREYLRMTREHLVFDICAAPFGVNYFFSCRLAELPAKVNILGLAILFVVFVVLLALSMKYLGFFAGLLIFAVFVVRTAENDYVRRFQTLVYVGRDNLGDDFSVLPGAL